MIVGYARVSRTEQHLELQLDALENAGCERIYRDQISGAKDSRPGLDECLRSLREGDMLVVWRLDRLGRSMKHLVDTMNDLNRRGIQLKSLQEEINTTTAMGTMLFHFSAMVAEFERNLIRERTLAGLEAARARGRNGGRKRKLNQRQIDQMKVLYDSKRVPVTEICKQFDIGRSSFYHYIKAA